MSDRTPEYGTILLDGVAFPVLQDSIGYQNLATFARKIVSGNPGRDSDDLISSKIWTGFPGGIGVLNNTDVADDGKAWFSTVYSRDPFQMTLNRRVVRVDDMKYPLGDLAGTYYASNGTGLYAWNEATDAFGSVIDTLDEAPVWRATAWGPFGASPKLYIPCGVEGYISASGSATDAINTAVQAVGFVAATDPQVARLYALCADGTLRSTFDGTNWQIDARINTAETPRRIIIWMDRQEQDTVFLVTDRSVYAWDPTTQVLVKTRLSGMPAHPDNGLGVETWRPGEDLYVTFGLQVMQYAAGMSQIAPMGPDRREGVPDELRGRFVDLCAELNAVMGLVEGVTTSGGGSPDAEADPGHEDEPAELSATRAVSGVLAYNGFGWHPLWQSGDDSGAPTWMCVSGAGLTQRAWWGWGDDAYTIELSRTFSNPSQQFRVGEGEFEETGTLDLGWFDANMREFEKLASHVEVNLESGSATETVTVEYDTDWDNNRRTLGTAMANGKTLMPFEVTTTDEGTEFSNGLPFRRVRFWWTWNRDPTDPSLTPVLDSVVLKHQRLPLSGEAYTVTIPLNLGPEGWMGRTAGQIKEELDHLLLKRGFIRLQHGDHPHHSSHRMRISFVNGVDRTGHDDRGARDITLVAVPLEDYEG